MQFFLSNHSIFEIDSKSLFLNFNKWGSALQYMTEFGLATKVKAGIKTSCLLLRPDKIHEICKAEVQSLLKSRTSIL